MVKGVPQRRFDQLLRLAGGQAFLRLALELGIADEDTDQGARLRHDVFRCDQASALLAGHFGVGLQTPR